MTYTHDDMLCPAEAHNRRIEFRGQRGMGSGSWRFLLPGNNPGRTAQVRCLMARVRPIDGGFSGVDGSNCTNENSTSIRARLVYAFPGHERSDYCDVDDSGDMREDCEDADETPSGACVRSRSGSEDFMTGRRNKKCVQIGGRNPGTAPGNMDVVPYSTAQRFDGDLVASDDLVLNMNATRQYPPFYFKSHSKSKAYFFLEYDVVTTTPGCRWTADISFTALAQNPDDAYCFTKAEAAFQPVRGNPFDLVDSSNGSWAENITNFNFDPPADLESRLPRSHNLMYTEDCRSVASGQAYTWVMGRGPTIDIDCVHLHSTATSFIQANTSMTVDHNGFENFTCRDSQYGHDGVPNMGAPKEFDEHHGTAARQERWALQLVDSYDCSAFTDPRKGRTLQFLRSSRFISQGFECDSSGACLWEQCCGFQTRAACQGLMGSTGVSQCHWVESEETCLPAVGASIVNLRPQVGVNAEHSFLSSIASQPLSSYVMTPEQVRFGYSGDTGRIWLLRYVNMYGNNAQPCSQTVTVGFRSTVHGGVCEPAGRALCDARADACTYASNWARFWPVAQGGQAVTAANLNPNQASKFTTCNCLKEQEVCYRNVGCTSTKRYQLIIQNCYDAGCGNTCNAEWEDGF